MNSQNMDPIKHCASYKTKKVKYVQDEKSAWDMYRNARQKSFVIQ